MTIEGHIYKRNAAVLFKIEEDVIEVLVISSIYEINYFFKGKCYDLNNYKRHFSAHILTNLNKETYISYESLYRYIPMHPRNTRVLSEDSYNFTFLYVIIFFTLSSNHF